MPSKDEIFAAAKRMHSAGDLRRAEQLYRAVVAADARDAQALFLHGSVCRQLGMENEAVESLQRATKLRPNDAEARHELGVVLARLGRLDDAVATLETAHRLRPDSAEISDNLRFVRAARANRRGAVLSEQANFAEAEAQFRAAIALVPDDGDMQYNLGVALRSQHRFEEAVTAFRRALDLIPAHVEASAALANVLLFQQNWQDAEASFRQAIALDPRQADLHVNLGNALKMQGKRDAALECYRQAVSLDPQGAEAHNNLGTILMDQGHATEAIAAYDRAIELKGGYVHALANRATALLVSDRLKEAERDLGEVLRLEPAHRQAHFNLAFVRMEQNRPEDALGCLAPVLDAKPNDADAHYHRAMTLLAMGRFAEGWTEYEWRWRRAGNAQRPLRQPRWTGEPLAGRTILLRGEQGLGDCIQFVRYAEPLKQQGATVVVECEAPLVRLFERCRGVDRAVAVGDSLPEFDVHAPLLSLPALLSTTLETIPRNVPYLETDAAEVTSWKARLSASSGLRVGIAWRGNPANIADRRRSIPLAEFAPLAGDGVQLVSLQVGSGIQESKDFASRIPIIDLGGQFRDLHDTAAALCSLDLVVACDSAPTHLAGSLGVPVWTALPFAADWRWLLDRDDSPWYPSMRLFRQARPGDWQGVFRRIAEALAALV